MNLLNLHNSIKTALTNQLNATYQTPERPAKPFYQLKCPCCGVVGAKLNPNLTVKCPTCPDLTLFALLGNLNCDYFIDKITKWKAYSNKEDGNYLFFNPTTGHHDQSISALAIKNALGADLFIQFQATVKTVGFGYNPFGTVEYSVRGEPFFNTYTPPEWRHNNFHFSAPIEPLPLPSIYYGYLNNLFGHDKPSIEYALDWMAYSLKARNQCYFVMLGEGGAGKGTLSNILFALHGQSNTEPCVGTKVLRQQFNTGIKNKTFVAINELELSEKEPELIARLKSLSDPYFLIEAKHKDEQQHPNYASFAISSNKRDALPNGGCERRYSLPRIGELDLAKNAPLLNGLSAKDYTERLVAPENITPLAHFLWNRTITRDMGVAFVDEEKLAEVNYANMKEWQEWFLETWIHIVKPDYTDQDGDILFGRFKADCETAVGYKIGQKKFADFAKNYPKVFKFRQGNTDDTRSKRYIHLNNRPQLHLVG